MKKLAIALSISLSLFCATPVLAQAPTLINFQGKLTDAKQKPVDGPAEVVFSIYDAAGSLLWSEHHNNVEVKKAIFNILLGSGMPNGAAEYPSLTDLLAANTEAWLEVQILDKTKTPLTWETMSPRQRLVSVAYSLHSETAVAADDVPGKDITPNSVTIPAHGQVIDNLGRWTGVTIPSSKLAEDDPQVKAQTVNRLPKWDGAALVDSTSITETATGNVGIGTAAPSEKLSVAGKIQTSGGIKFGNDTVQTTAGVTKEEDPTIPPEIKTIIKDGKIDLMTEVQGVHSSLKDGINWDEVIDKPTSFGITQEKDPKVGSLSANHIPKWDDSLEALVNSSSIFENTTGVGIRTTDPKQTLDVDGKIRMRNQTAATDAADTVATKGYVDTSLPGSLADGVISWGEIQGIPDGLDDGDNVGITSETDPQVKAATANRIPKWNGSALVDSGAINETAAGNVGIGTTSPQEKLHVAGNITASQNVSAAKMTASTSMSTPRIYDANDASYYVDPAATSNVKRVNADYASLDEAQLNKVVTEGTTCSPNGRLARDAGGLILSCQSGSWKTMGASFPKGRALYVGVVQDCNAGVVTTNPHHLNCSTAFIGYLMQ